MILGTGIDLTDIRRIEKALARFGARFENRVFTEGERAKAKSRENAGTQIVAATYAKRFAAKEACAKALGVGNGITWQDIEIINTENGAPSIRLSGNALKRLQQLTPKGLRTTIHLALTDEYPLAQAQVIIEAL